MEEEGIKSNDKPWLFTKDKHPISPGRPKGSGKSLKEYSREFLANMTEEERLDYLNGLPKDIIWKMAEGNPDTKQDVTIREKPIPLDPDVSKDNSLQENKEPIQEN